MNQDDKMVKDHFVDSTSDRLLPKYMLLGIKSISLVGHPFVI